MGKELSLRVKKWTIEWITEKNGINNKYRHRHSPPPSRTPHPTVELLAIKRNRYRKMMKFFRLFFDFSRNLKTVVSRASNQFSLCVFICEKGNGKEQLKKSGAECRAEETTLEMEREKKLYKLRFVYTSATPTHESKLIAAYFMNNSI